MRISRLKSGLYMVSIKDYHFQKICDSFDEAHTEGFRFLAGINL